MLANELAVVNTKVISFEQIISAGSLPMNVQQNHIVVDVLRSIKMSEFRYTARCPAPY